MKKLATILLLAIFFGVIATTYLFFENLSVLLNASEMAVRFLKTTERNTLIDQNLERYTTPYSCKDCNVVFISIDTLRSDRTGFMGYSRDTTPNLDTLANESIIFENSFVQAPSTTPSHASIFTSLYPSQHGAIREAPLPPLSLNKVPSIKEGIVSLAEIMNINGYKTAAFVGDAAVSSLYGFSRGFELYNENNHFLADSIPKAIEWLERSKDEKFFLFIHGYEPHAPYGQTELGDIFIDNSYDGFFKNYTLMSEDISSYANKKNNNFSGDDIDYINAKYDGDIKYADKQIGMFIDTLKSMGLYNKTLLIIFSDHGEYLGEFEPYTKKFIFGHGGLFDEVLRQVLIIKHPKFNFSKRIKSIVSSIDIAPTVLELTGIGRFEKFEGTSLTKTIFNENLESFSISESFSKRADTYATSIRTLKWRLTATDIELSGSENDKKDPAVNKDTTNFLYKVENSEKELDNVAIINKNVSTELLKTLAEITRNKNAEIEAGLNASNNKIDKLLEKLRRLGYVE